MATAPMAPDCPPGTTWYPVVGGCYDTMPDLGDTTGDNVTTGEWVDITTTLSATVGALVTGTTQSAATATTETGTLVLQPEDGLFTLDLTYHSSGNIIPGSVRFATGGLQYLDTGSGTLYDSTGAILGTIDYAEGLVTLKTWPQGATMPPTVTSCLGTYGQWGMIAADFHAAYAPLKPEALQVVATTENGRQIIGTADADGNIVGDEISGRVNYQFGVAVVHFGSEVESASNPGTTYWRPTPIDPSTLRYNAVAYSYLPLDADILGVDSVRLPADGRVPIYRDGDIVQIMHTAETAPITPTLNTPISVGRTRLAWARVIDASGATVSGTKYTLDRANGTVTFTDLTDVATPVTIKHTVGDLRMVTDAQISGWLTLSRPLTHDYPADESIIASCLIFGDRRARVSTVFDQASWDGTWEDAVQGSEATATLNTIDFPITVTNEGADTDRWVFRCTSASSNQWELISEKRGLVWSGTYSPGGDDVAPINARTRTWDEETGQWIGGVPYMTIPGHANGGGWSTGNVVRINTVGAIADFWVARSIQQSDEPLDDGYDSVEIYALGNVDRP